MYVVRGMPERPSRHGDGRPPAKAGPIPTAKGGEEERGHLGNIIFLDDGGGYGPHIPPVVARVRPFTLLDERFQSALIEALVVFRPIRVIYIYRRVHVLIVQSRTASLIVLDFFGRLF